jgi:hypothetical protein
MGLQLSCELLLLVVFLSVDAAAHIVMSYCPVAVKRELLSHRYFHVRRKDREGGNGGGSFGGAVRPAI